MLHPYQRAMLDMIVKGQGATQWVMFPRSMGRSKLHTLYEDMERWRNLPKPADLGLAPTVYDEQGEAHYVLPVAEDVRGAASGGVAVPLREAKTVPRLP